MGVGKADRYDALRSCERLIGLVSPARTTSGSVTGPPWWMVAGGLIFGGMLLITTLQSWLSQSATATAILSPPTYRHLLESVGNTTTERIGSTEFHTVPWASLAFWTVGGMAFLVAAGAAGLCVGTSSALRLRLVKQWSLAVGCAAIAIGLWDWAWLAASLMAGEFGQALTIAIIPFWLAVCFAGLATTWLMLRGGVPHSPSAAEPTIPTWPRRPLLGLMLVYLACFVSMNWCLWFNLYLPHGDSAMYEEHLWNLLHGKGFRSYLDQGLFLGEHLQIVHLGLIPVYLIWPSHLLLELCESCCLALGALPVAWMTWRHSHSRTAALAIAAAYLLYTPTQFLDIEIDLKTFRPEAFGIPLLLFTLDQLDRGRWWGVMCGVLACLTVKEDVSLILTPLGFWIAATTWRATRKPDPVNALHGRRWLLTGIGLALFGLLYLWLATRVIMPYFRPGQEIHYASYFSRLGESPEAIVRTVLTRPGYVLGEVANLQTLLYALALLVPVAGAALASPGRLAVGLPLFGILCLNELARDPRHQFHAWLVPIVFWAVACGFPNFCGLIGRVMSAATQSTWKNESTVRLGAHAIWTSAFATGLFFSLSPFGIPFWDPGSHWSWQHLYRLNDRGPNFVKVQQAIPPSSRVASTDFVHPRFTHYDRSYDYSQYLRRVSGYEHRVPDDTDYIVIDATHPYSQMHQPADVPEFHESDRWELLPIDTGGHFIVLQRKHRETGTAMSDQ
ncbi:DUF2079 domain-containing protein [bacterium]|nr:DUF2079 domain-containing protein [bacterium]